MAQALRELLLSLKIKADKAAIAETDKAFDNATKAGAKFEKVTAEMLWPLKKVGAQIRENTRAAQAFANARLNAVRGALLPAGALPTPRPEAPSDRKAREERDALGLPHGPQAPRPGQSLAAPDVSQFLVQADTRSGPAKALDALKFKAQSALTSAGAYVDRFNARFDSTAAAIFNARTAMAGFAVVVAGTAIGRFFNDVIEAGGALHDMSKRTRVSVESLQVWRSIATDVGADAGAIEGAFRKLTRSMAAAARGSKLPASSFAELGVQFKNADGSLRPVEDVLIDTGSALAALDDDAKASALAVQLLGPAGAALVPAFNGGAAAVRKLSADLRENVALNAEEAERLDDVGDALGRGVKKWTAIKARIAVMMLPVLEAVANGFEKVSKWTLRMVKETSTLQTIAASLAGVGLFRVVTMLGAWVTKVGGARAALALLSGGLRAAALTTLQFVAPLLILEDFLTFLAGGKSVFGRAMEEIFGEGGAKSAREGILKTFSDLSKILQEQVMPVIKAIADNPFVNGALKVAGETLLGILNLIGIAFAKDSDKIDELGSRFLTNTNAIGDAIDGLISKMKEFLGLGEETPTFDAPELTEKSKALAAKSTWFADKPAPKNFAEMFGAPRTGGPVPRAAGPVPVPSAASMPGAQGSTKTINLTDQSKIEINVDSSGKIGREVAKVLEAPLEKNRKQVLHAM